MQPIIAWLAYLDSQMKLKMLLAMFQHMIKGYMLRLVVLLLSLDQVLLITLHLGNQSLARKVGRDQGYCGA